MKIDDKGCMISSKALRWGKCFNVCTHKGLGDLIHSPSAHALTQQKNLT